nr:hypothetical protein [Saccharothrix yanglingensis]
MRQRLRLRHRGQGRPNGRRARSAGDVVNHGRLGPEGRDGVVFVPFHYGYWDTGGDRHARAANEPTPTEWDPVSKQPLFKVAAVRVTRIGDGTRPAPAPITTASAPHDPAGVPATAGEDDVREDVAPTGPPAPPPVPERTPDVPHPAPKG